MSKLTADINTHCGGWSPLIRAQADGGSENWWRPVLQELCHPRGHVTDPGRYPSAPRSFDPGSGFRIPSPLPTIKEVRIGGVCVH